MANVQLDTKRLKHIRKSKRLSVKQLVSNAFSNGETKSKSVDNQIRMYQNIEKTGRTSVDRARRIEDALGMPHGMLEAGADVSLANSSIAERIEARARTLLESQDLGELSRLAKLLCVKTEELTKGGDWPWLDLAAELSQRVALERLLGNTEQLREISEVTGLSDRELPANLSGDTLWWLTINEWHTEIGLGKLLLGVAGVRAEIEDVWSTRLPYFDCSQTPKEIRASLRQIGKHFRLDITGENLGLRSTFEFCATHASRDRGIQWVEAGDWEREEVFRLIGDLIRERADVVEIEGQQSPPQNANLGMQVEFCEIKTAKWELPKWQPLGVKAFTNGWDFRCALQSYLKAHPAERWDFQATQGNVTISLRPETRTRDWKDPEFVSKFVIRNGWFDESGQFHDAPWPEARRKEAIGAYQTLRDGIIIVLDDEYVIPSFSPDAPFSGQDPA